MIAVAVDLAKVRLFMISLFDTGLFSTDYENTGGAQQNNEDDDEDADENAIEEVVIYWVRFFFFFFFFLFCFLLVNKSNSNSFPTRDGQVNWTLRMSSGRGLDRLTKNFPEQLVRRSIRCLFCLRAAFLRDL
jgi:hypothetical protein